MRVSTTRRTTADDVRRVALAALSTALDDGKQEVKAKPGLTGVRAVATGAVLYTAGRAVFTGRRFVREHLGAEAQEPDDERDEADQEYDDEPAAGVGEDDEEYDDPRAEADEDEESEAGADEDEEYDDEPRAEADEDEPEDEEYDDEPEAGADEDEEYDDEQEAGEDDDDEPRDDEPEAEDDSGRPSLDLPRRRTRTRSPASRN